MRLQKRLVQLSKALFAILLALFLRFENVLASANVDPTGASDSTPPAVVTPPNFVSATGKALQGKLQIDVEKCNQAGLNANKICISSKNPTIMTAGGALGILTSTISSSEGQKEQCKKFGSAMDIVNTALTAYNAACTTMQVRCQMSCSSLKNQKKFAEKQLQAALSLSTIQPSEASLINQDLALLRSKTEVEIIKAEVTCKSYLLNLAAGVAGLTKVLQSAKSTKNCGNQTTVAGGVDCKLNPTDPTCAPKPIDCAVEANKTTIECICRANPIAQGCPGGGSQTDNGNTIGGGNNITNNVDEGKVGGPDLNGSGGDEKIAGRDLPKSGADSSGAGGGIGTFGGGGGGGGLGLSGTAGKPVDQAVGKKLNSNILQGYDGGSGGGGHSFGGSDSADPDSRLRQYMPGAKNDPSRGLAGARTDGMTGAAGLSNWEKVRTRYGDNKGSLIGGGL